MRALAPAVLLSMACSSNGGGPEPLDVDPNIQSIHAEVFARSCVFTSSCHNQNAREGTLLLGCEQGGSVAPTSDEQIQLACWNLLNVDVVNSAAPEASVRVVPFSSSASFFIDKLRAKGLVPTGDEDETNCPMPWNNACDESDALPANAVTALRQWIDEGAPGCEEAPSSVPPPTQETEWRAYWTDYCENGPPQQKKQEPDGGEMPDAGPDA